MMVIQQVRIRVKTTPDLVKTSEDRGKDANKETLETEKEKDTTQKVTVNRRRRSESTRWRLLSTSNTRSHVWRHSAKPETPPLWNPQDSFVKSGDDETQMVGQGLCRSIEEVLEWHTDYARDEECVLNYLTCPWCFLEGGTGDEQVVDVNQCAYGVTINTHSSTYYCELVDRPERCFTSVARVRWLASSLNSGTTSCRPYEQLLGNFDLTSTIRDQRSKVEIHITVCIQRF